DTDKVVDIMDPTLEGQYSSKEVVQVAAIAAMCFFFSGRRRHTRFSRDWSSDVCSSDRPAAERPAGQRQGRPQGPGRDPAAGPHEIGRASCRKGEEVSKVGEPLITYFYSNNTFFQGVAQVGR